VISLDLRLPSGHLTGYFKGKEHLPLVRVAVALTRGRSRIFYACSYAAAFLDFSYTGTSPLSLRSGFLLRSAYWWSRNRHAADVPGLRLCCPNLGKRKEKRVTTA
jgi:hypothetical protein